MRCGTCKGARPTTMSNARPPRIGVLATVLLVAVALAGGRGDTGPAGPAGTDGTNGNNGANGTNGSDGVSCTVVDNHDGSSTIQCTDGTSVVVTNGTNGVSCTVTDNGNGTRTITCADGSSVTVSDAVVDYAVMTPAELEAAN